jgi:hypothetical protein
VTRRRRRKPTSFRDMSSHSTRKDRLTSP